MYLRKFRLAYIPTIFDNIVVEVELDGKPIELSLWDTAGKDDLDRLHCLLYPESDIIFFCFSIDSPSSLQHITTRWLTQVKHYCHRTTPYILVGCKSDTRDISRSEKGTMTPIVSQEEAVQIGQSIGAIKYLECSSMTFEGVLELFELASRATLCKQPSWNCMPS